MLSAEIRIDNHGLFRILPGSKPIFQDDAYYMGNIL